MITRALLMVSHPAVALEKIGRETVLERQIKTAHQAGIQELWLGGHQPQNFPSEPLPQGITLYWISSNNGTQKSCLTPYSALSDQHLIDTKVLREVISKDYADPISFVDEAGRMVIQIMAPPKEEFKAQEIKPLPPGSSILLERPFLIKGVFAWTKNHGLNHETTPGIFKKIFNFISRS